MPIWVAKWREAQVHRNHGMNLLPNPNYSEERKEGHVHCHIKGYSISDLVRV